MDSLKGQPVFIAMQGEGREWTQMFSRRAVALFDYTFTDGAAAPETPLMTV